MAWGIEEFFNQTVVGKVLSAPLLPANLATQGIGNAIAGSKNANPTTRAGAANMAKKSGEGVKAGIQGLAIGAVAATGGVAAALGSGSRGAKPGQGAPTADGGAQAFEGKSLWERFVAWLGEVFGGQKPNSPATDGRTASGGSTTLSQYSYAPYVTDPKTGERGRFK